MKRVIAFLILLTLPIGFLTGAHKAVNALQDDVVITASHVYGDPKRVEGIKIRTLTTCGDHMWWYTDHIPADPGTTEAKFHFSQKGHGFFDREHDWHDFTLTNTNGMGMSTSGGEGLEFVDEGMGLLINAVAQRTPPGESREEAVALEDYFDYYPLEYWVNFQAEDYYIDEMYDTIRMGNVYPQGETLDGGGIPNCYLQWIENFRFPIQPGDTMNITVGKDEAGSVREIYVSANDVEIGASVSFSTIAVKNGMYFSPVFQTWDGTAIETGEYVYGYGLYYIPFKPVGHTEGTPPWVTFDFDGLEMVYSLKSTDRLVSMEKSADGKSLHLLVNEGGAYVYCFFDIETRAMISRTEIMSTSEDANWAFYPEEELLYILSGEKMALVGTGTDSRVELIADWPEEVSRIVPSAVCYREGVLYGTSLEWSKYENEGYGVCLIACDKDGLGYLGYYLSNLGGTGYNSAWINLESAELIME